jgi:WD40 repeat protein
MSDIYDLAWSPDGQYICAGLSIDNAARIWNVTTRALLFCLGIENLYFP